MYLHLIWKCRQQNVDQFVLGSIRVTGPPVDLFLISMCSIVYLLEIKKNLLTAQLLWLGLNVLSPWTYEVM